jgi:POT family proton-dependent oligopeptide transporter
LGKILGCSFIRLSTTFNQTPIAGLVAQKYNYNKAFAVAAGGLIIALFNIFVCLRTSLKGVGTKIIKDKLVSIVWENKDKYNFIVYLLLCISNILWNVFYALPYGLLTLYADHNINRQILGLTIPSTWYYGAYGIFIILLSPLVALGYNFIEKTFKLNFTLSYKLSIGYLLVALGSYILLPLIAAITINSNFLGSSWYLILFYLLFAFSELLTVPVLLSAANKFSMPNYKASFIAMNMFISWGIGAWLGGEFGALTQKYNPLLMFKIIIALCLLFSFLHLFTNKYVEKYF